MAKQKGNFLSKLIGNKSNIVGKKLFQIVGGHKANFSTFNGEIYDEDIIRTCIDSIARHSAKFVPKHYKKQDENRINIQGNINFLLSNRPNPIMTTYDFIYKTISLLFCDTDVFIYLDKDENDKLIGFYPISYYRTEFLKDDDDRLYIRFWLPNGKQYEFPYDDLIHLRKFFNKEELFGSGNECLTNALQNQITAEEGIGNAIKTSNSLRGIIKYTQNLKEPDIKSNRDAFVNDFMNDKGTGIAALDNKGEFKELNLKPITLDKEQLEHVNQRVLNYFGINKSIVSSDFTPGQWNAFYESVLEPLSIYLSQSFTNKIFSNQAIKDGNTIEFTVNRVRYASMETKIQIVKEVGSMGILTVDQALDILELPMIGGEEGKKRMQSLNYINSSIADIYQLKNIKKKGSDKDE